MPHHPGYPLHLMNLVDQPVLLVGAGAVAAEKLPPLLRCGAQVHVVAPRVGSDFADTEGLVLHRRRFERDDVRGKALVITATDDPDVNQAVIEAARAEGILCNAADQPDLCDFYVPASVQRGPVLVSISTHGGSPLLAGRVRRYLQAVLPEALTEVAGFFVQARQRGLKGLARKSSLLRALASPVVAGFVERNDDEAAFRALTALATEPEPFPPGTVSIVGAGPGGAGLLTLRALDRLQRADVVLHDALVTDEILALVPPSGERLQVGRRVASQGGGRYTREERLEVVLAHARRGLRVVRLHAGDPFVFGCGGEEVDALDRAGIPWEIVPGVSSAVAAPAMAGVPLTRRGVARGFSVRTGHLRTGPTRGELPQDEETVVVLMGLGAIEDVLAELIAEGRAPSTPAVAISHATRDEQRIVRGTLADLAASVRAAGLVSPTTLVIGEVAAAAAVRGVELAA